MPRKVRANVGKAIFVGSDLIRVEARRLIAQGAIQGAGHVPSKPGEPPNWDTGDLAGNIVNAKTGSVTAETTSNAGHAIDMEFGNSKVEERPYMRPATQRKRNDVLKLVVRGVNLAARG